STQMQERLRQSYLGWTSIKDFFNDFTRYRLELDDTARRYENGTLNFIGITSLHESIATLIEVGIRNIEEHVLDLADILISEVEAIGLKTVVAGDRSQRAGIISIQVPNADAYSAKLREAKIEVAVRQGLIRVSPHFYNTKEEIEYLVDTMKKIYKYHSTAS
ncbi:MAG: aminotransferase class V-fold PLP-dependent enzyme, partial [Candidatus Kryptoniota bacterium]